MKCYLIWHALFFELHSQWPISDTNAVSAIKIKIRTAGNRWQIDTCIMDKSFTVWYFFILNEWYKVNGRTCFILMIYCILDKLTSSLAVWLINNEVDNRGNTYQIKTEVKWFFKLFVLFALLDSMIKYLFLVINCKNIFFVVIDLIYWKDIKKTAIVFGIFLLILLFLAYHTLLSVISFFALSFLTVSALYRIGMTVISALQKTDSRTSYQYVEGGNIMKIFFIQDVI